MRVAAPALSCVAAARACNCISPACAAVRLEVATPPRVCGCTGAKLALAGPLRVMAVPSGCRRAGDLDAQLQLHGSVDGMHVVGFGGGGEGHLGAGCGGRRAGVASLARSTAAAGQGRGQGQQRCGKGMRGARTEMHGVWEVLAGLQLRLCPQRRFPNRSIAA